MMEAVSPPARNARASPSLMSISGLHVTMLAWLGGLAVARLWRLSPRAMLALPAPQAVANPHGLPFSGGWFVYLGYDLLSEFEPTALFQHSQ